MRSTTIARPAHTRRPRTRWAVAGVAAATAGLMIGVAGPAEAATPVGLGTATSFAVLAGAGVTNTGPTTLNGDLGTFPTTSISGAGSLTVTGTVHGGDAVTQDAKTDLVTAYGVAAGQASNQTISADLAGATLVSGVYTSASSMGLSGALTLDAAGDPDAVFVFQVASALTVAGGSQVLLTNGAQACNVIWQVGSSATIGTGAAFRGTVLALTDITMVTGATVEGRLLARNGAVTLDTNVVTRPACTTPSGSTGTTTAQDAAARAAADAAAAELVAAELAAGSPPAASQVTRTPLGGVSTGDGSAWGDGPQRAVHPAEPQGSRVVGASLVGALLPASALVTSVG
ncbi:MAG: DUF3494 domain-containing protein [Cellulomonas sp.]|nr:DUF3494 domain-containing protein [Cellulomonas sp.]